MNFPACPHCGQALDSGGRCRLCGITAPSSQETPSGGFEWKTRAALFGIPLVHVAFGRDPGGRRKVAKGVIAVGQIAFGLITVAQCGVGILFALGQFVLGPIAVGQIAFGVIAGIGQVSVGFLAVGQLVVGIYGLGQFGWAKYLWSLNRIDMDAVALFYTIQLRIRQFLGLPW